MTAAVVIVVMMVVIGTWMIVGVFLVVMVWLLFCGCCSVVVGGSVDINDLVISIKH